MRRIQVSENQATATQRVTLLVLGVASVMVIWFGVFPLLRQNPAYQIRQTLLDDRQIDPSAMFYTELECLDRALADTKRYRNVGFTK